MTGEATTNVFDKISEGLTSFSGNLADLQENVIDANINKLIDKVPLDNVFSVVESVDGILKSDTGFGSLSDLLGIKIFDLDAIKNNRLLNKFTSNYGGIEGLQKLYIQKILDKVFTDHPEKKDTIKAMYKKYIDTKQVCANKETDATGLNVTCELGLSSTVATSVPLLAKLPDVTFTSLRDSMVATVKGGESILDPKILSDVTSTKIPSKTLADGSVVVDTTATGRNLEDTMEKFIKARVKTLASNTDFMEKIQDQNSFILALMGSLFVKNNMYPQSILLGITDPSEYGVVTVPQTTTPTPETATIPAYTGEVKTTADFVNYTKWTILSHESGGNYGAVNKDDVGSVSLGLLQRHNERAQELVKSLEAKDPAKFSSIMGDGFKDLNVASLWNSPWDDDKADRFALLMKEDVFQKAMDDYVNNDVRSYIKKAHDKGLTDPKVIVLYCNMLNAGSGWAESELEKIPASDRNNPQKVYEAIIKTDFVTRYSGVKRAYDKLYSEHLASITLPQLDFSQMA